MKKALLYIHQLPQNLLGLLLTCFWKAEMTVNYRGTKVRINESFPSGISLGNYIIVKHFPISRHTWNSVKHEYGHSIQSKRYGWFYLPIIGLPSLLGNIYDRLFHKSAQWYYNLPWEKGADNLGGVVRL